MQHVMPPSKVIHKQKKLRFITKPFLWLCDWWFPGVTKLPNSTQNSSALFTLVADGGACRKALCPTGISSLTSGQDYFQLQGASIRPSDQRRSLNKHCPPLARQSRSCTTSVSFTDTHLNLKEPHISPPHQPEYMCMSLKIQQLMSYCFLKSVTNQPKCPWPLLRACGVLIPGCSQTVAAYSAI